VQVVLRPVDQTRQPTSLVARLQCRLALHLVPKMVLANLARFPQTAAHLLLTAAHLLLTAAHPLLTSARPLLMEPSQKVVLHRRSVKGLFLLLTAQTPKVWPQVRRVFLVGTVSATTQKSKTPSCALGTVQIHRRQTATGVVMASVTRSRSMTEAARKTVNKHDVDGPASGNFPVLGQFES